MNYLKENIENYKKDLKKLISFETYLTSRDDYPNQAQKNALEYIKTLSEKDGFKSYIDPQGYYGYIEIGEGEELIGLLAHLDVVPPGDINEWNSNPFDMHEVDGKLIGRGTSDDKGPFMLVYYLLKEYKDKPLNKRIRIIFGTDEESAWRGINKYNEFEESVTIGFTPDASFPVAFQEREIIQIKLTSIGSDVLTLKGGVAPNVVPNFAEFKMDEKITIEEGIAAHAMDPSKGVNAISKLVSNIAYNIHPIIDFIKNEIKLEYNGETLLGKLIKDEYITQTCNLGLVNIDGKGSEIILDFRIPSVITGKQIYEIINKKIKLSYPNIKSEIYKNNGVVNMDKNSKLIKDMTMAYKEVIGDKLEPVTASGGTYAKAMKNTVAYGPLFPWNEHSEHKVNEYIIIEDYIKAYEIYRVLIEKWIS